MKLGQAARQEFEYIRHGTTTLIGIWDVVVGKMFSETIGPTRNEADFVNHICVIHPIHKASLEDALGSNTLLEVVTRRLFRIANEQTASGEHRVVPRFPFDRSKPRKLARRFW